MKKQLISYQNRNGSFSDSKGRESIFFTSLILSFLNKIEEDKNIKNIKKKAVDFLISQKNKKGIFSNDLAINFSILSSLLEYNEDKIEGKTIANFLQILTSNESKEGGPYYSKISKKKEIDIYVNSQIGYFLSLLDVNLPNVIKMIENAISFNDFISSYFEKPYFPIYVISKLYYQIDENDRNNNNNDDKNDNNKNNRNDENEENKEKLIKYILKNKGDNILENSLSAISLFNLNCSITRYSDLIGNLKNYSKKELEETYSFGKSKSTKALTLSLYLEAIECLNRIEEKKKEKRRNTGKKDKGKEKKEKHEKEKKEQKEEKEMFNKILNIAKKRFSLLEVDIRNFAFREIEKTMKGNTDKQMSLISYYFKKALGERGKKISDEIVAQTGLANIFYWTAFIIFDDFWDEDEAADPRILSTANLYSRDFLFFFNNFFKNDIKFQMFVREIMDRLDSANTWETVHCRTKKQGNKIVVPEKFPNFKDYTIKYEPASAHILGPIVILKMIGFNENSSQARNTIKYFKNYLITKQFNDDLHDWEEDLERGHLSTTTAEILKIFAKKYPHQKMIDLKKDKEKLQKIYWFEVLPKLCKISLKYSKSSRQALNKLDIFEEKSYLEQFIDLPEKHIKDALKEQKKSIDFLENYLS
jgi:hypothetical protein